MLQARRVLVSFLLLRVSVVEQASDQFVTLALQLGSLYLCNLRCKYNNPSFYIV